jgi:hypothetical protein
MASIDGKRLGNNINLINVKAITLEKNLDKQPLTNIDFLSLDTEGYELNILNGLNLDKYRPNYMLIEIYQVDYDDIVKFLESKKYTKKTNPIWDGTHNDFMFIDNLKK